ncbi:MAG: flagellar hook-length control protein FliK [Caulobacteraceae bacterium]
MRIDSASIISIRPELLELVKNLEAGDVLKGRVLEALKDSITIKTSGGQVFTAALLNEAEIQKGAFVELTINNVSDGKIYAELKTDRAVPDLNEKISDALKQLSFPVNEKTLEAGKMLIKYNLPLNRETMTKMLSIQNSVAKLSESREGKIGLLLSGMNIKDAPVEVLNKIVMHAEPEVREVLKQVQASVEQPEQQTVDKSAANIKSPEKVQEVEVNLPAGRAVAENVENKVEEGNTPLMAKTDEKTGEQKTEAKGFPVEIQVLAKDGLEADTVKVLSKLGVDLSDEVKQLSKQVESLLSVLKDVDTEALTFLMSKSMEITPGNIGLIVRHLKNADKISDFLGKLQEQIGVSGNPELKGIKESIRKVFLRPVDIKDGEEIKEQYRDMVRLGEKLESLLDGSSFKNDDTKEMLANLKDNIDFIRNINQYSNYLQIPLMMNENSATAKLYVFKGGKRSRNIDPQNATILVALDLQNAGHIESLIGLQGNNVNITFRTEDKRTGDIIRKEAASLAESLQAKGYTLSPVKVINNEQAFNLFALEEVINENNADRIHFDMRV